MGTKKSQSTSGSKPLVKDIRDNLKALVQQELDQLPDTLKGLDAEKRLNFLCKLLLYIVYFSCLFKLDLSQYDGKKLQEIVL